MTRSILVPLDGSRLAEAALPQALLLARALGASIALLHVVEKASPRRVHGDIHLRTADEAESYLASTEERLVREGATASRHVHQGPAKRVAESIASHLLEIPYDYVVLCTHGSGGPGRALMGSVGQRVLAGASVPVLMVRPSEEPLAAAARYGTIMVALETGHTDSLPVAAELARACSARLHLLVVIPTYATRRGGLRAVGRFLPGATLESLDQETEAVELYLAERRRELEAGGLTVTAQAARGDPGTVILEGARWIAPDLTVMATHGHRGLGAFWHGSVASEVCARCERPVLLVPVAGR